VAKHVAMKHTDNLNLTLPSTSSWFGKASKATPADALLQMPKSAAKLLAAARKGKEVLSANKDTTMSINTITPDGADLKTKMTRSEMEAAAAPTIARAAAPLRRLLRLGGKGCVKPTLICS
jgi:molecular chaperone DnaK (HSP70)